MTSIHLKLFGKIYAVTAKSIYSSTFYGSTDSVMSFTSLEIVLPLVGD